MNYNSSVCIRRLRVKHFWLHIWDFKCYNFHFNNYVGLSIEIQVNGTATTRTQFCIGEIVSFVCRHDTSIYAGLSLKRASAVLYRTTFPTKEEKKI